MLSYTCPTNCYLAVLAASWHVVCEQEETVRELTAALEAKDRELDDVRQQAAAEADAAVLSKMEVGPASQPDVMTAGPCGSHMQPVGGSLSTHAPVCGVQAQVSCLCGSGT